ncbi:hypothetical protein A1A1_15668 [Planococcus antarcticus DSM 14505]|uniref:DUF4181 domain-containing protein n=1 Tax=Planococcus antarcticus DSM 14505 TaxID=1185653 RepID=A0AA87IJV3_9BACL|nr:DUF4181 domain-containing protein [Planococcus antarcticus]EIM05527.1 hypothetical protein A1A1_15668 [Planococcus antarcticus DSM 14505]
MDTSLLFIWLLVIFGFHFFRMFLKKRFGIDKEAQAGVPVNKFERWNGWLTVAAIIALAIVIQGSLEKFAFWLFLIFFMGSVAQIYLEWKYLKGSRKYQVSLLYFSVVAVALVVFIKIVSSQVS